MESCVSSLDSEFVKLGSGGRKDLLLDAIDVLLDGTFCLLCATELPQLGGFNDFLLGATELTKLVWSVVGIDFMLVAADILLDATELGKLLRLVADTDSVFSTVDILHDPKEMADFIIFLLATEFLLADTDTLLEATEFTALD
mmetsp:Transcript_31559/g.62526  ORF Transcript_31559/g.62526 Transcript_31559/m.62526 type:complete len:143 (-) Transcript_31559:323-751(-)